MSSPSPHPPHQPFHRADQAVDAFVASQRARGALEAGELRLLAQVSVLIDRTAMEPDAAGRAGRPAASRDGEQTAYDEEPTRPGDAGATSDGSSDSDSEPSTDAADSGRDRKAREWARRRQDRSIARRSIIAELATATRISEWTIARMLGQATDLCDRFAPAVDALAHGEITRAHLLVIHETGSPIENPDDLTAFLHRALEVARCVPPGRLRPALTAIAESYRDLSLAQRAREAAERRHTGVRDLADGLAELFAVLPATLAKAIDDRLTTQARTIIDTRTTDPSTGATATTAGGTTGDTDITSTLDDAGDETTRDTGATSDTHHDTGHHGGDAGHHADDDGPVDTRTFDQVRADVLTDLLLTGTPDTCLGGDGLGEIRATVQITVPVLTMTGHSTAPCLLAGYGPIDPTMAAELAGATPRWERVMTSPVDGAILAVDRYRPGPALQRFLRARDEHCRFPGCRRDVWRCDIDHTIDHAHGGTTCDRNLAHLCRRHHMLKHHSAWTVAQIAPGVLVWTSPSGRKHTDRPEPVVRFVPDDELVRLRTRFREPWLLPPESADAPF